MTDYNRGIMKFDGADNGGTIALFATVLLGSIGFLIVWALRVAYVVG